MTLPPMLERVRFADEDEFITSVSTLVVALIVPDTVKVSPGEVVPMPTLPLLNFINKFFPRHSCLLYNTQ